MTTSPALAMDQPGLYGKLPAFGDFVTRRLPRTYVEAWDHWITRAMDESRQQLGSQWLDAYLTSPVWRFALSPVLGGGQVWAGVMIPSVDRVGRYYPLTLAVNLPVHTSLMGLVAGCTEWFERAQTLLLDALDDKLDLETFDARILALSAPRGATADGSRAPARASASGRIAWRLNLPTSIDNAGDLAPGLADQLLNHYLPAHSVWWSEGSDKVGPSLLLCEGLPATAGYGALLNGQWAHHGWDDRDVFFSLENGCAATGALPQPS